MLCEEKMKIMAAMFLIHDEWNYSSVDFVPKSITNG